MNSAYPSAPGFEVELTSRGGFAGMTKGHVLHEDGYVYRWQAIVRPDSLGLPLGRVSPAIMDSMFKLVSADGLLDIGATAQGNMLRTMRVRLGDREQRWIWAAGLGGRGIPQAIGPVRDLLLSAIRQVETGPLGP